MRSRSTILSSILITLTVGLFLLDLAVGAVNIPIRDVWAALTGGDCPRATEKIVLNIRLIKAIVALLAGAALSVSGLQMQTLFRNPLAGPYVLGISSGASLGVALVVLAGLGSSIGIAGAAWVGAAVVLLVITAVGQRIKDIMVILILGMMFSSGVGAVVQILQYIANDESLKMFVIWTMGALGDVTAQQLAIFVPSVLVGLLLAVITIKSLNLLLFGEEYAITMGLNIQRSRGLLFLSTTLLAGTITAFCGPIGFIGLAMETKHQLYFDRGIHYAEVCTWYGALRFAELTNNKELIKLLRNRFELLFHLEKELLPPPIHVDQNMFGCLPLRFYNITKDKRYLDLGLPYADTQWELPANANEEERKWDKKGYSWQTRLWIDDMYMITIVQSEAYKATGDPKYINRAAKEMVLYLDELQHPNGLFYHAPDGIHIHEIGESGFSELLICSQQESSILIHLREASSTHRLDNLAIEYPQVN